MIWTADRIIHDGLALRDMGLDIAPNGRVRGLAPLAVLPPPDRVLPGRAILAGRINPYHHGLSALERVFDNRPSVAGVKMSRPSQGALQPNWVDSITPNDLYDIACAAYVRLLACGITCVGEVHSLRYQPNGAFYPNPLVMAEALLAAAQDTGIRIALIDNVRLRQPGHSAAPQPACQSAPNFEVACSDFDAVVENLLSRHNPNLSWALGAHSLEAVPYEALVGLRVRLGHMPFFMPLGEGNALAPSGLGLNELGPCPITTLSRRGVLDACMTVVATESLSAAAVAALAQAGSTLCLCLTPTGALTQTPGALARSTRPFTIPCVASGSADAAGLAQAYADWPSVFTNHDASDPQSRPRPTVAHVAGDMNKVAATALGVDAGNFEPGRWGDLISIILPCGLDDACKPQIEHPQAEAAHAAERIWRHLLANPPEEVVRDVVIAGAPVVLEGVHPLTASAQTNLALLAQRVAAGN